MISVFILGFLFSFIGFTPPSVLNMTALNIRLHKQTKDFNYFLFGVLTIVLFQVYFAIYITKYLASNSEIIKLLEQFGIIVLLFLSFYFYQKNKQEKKEVTLHKRNKYTFLNGVILSLLNMFAIPFFCGIIALLSNYELMYFDVYSVFLFIIGSVLGTFYILYLYGKFAFKIQHRSNKLTSNINMFLSVITAVFAFLTFLKFVV